MNHSKQVLLNQLVELSKTKLADGELEGAADKIRACLLLYGSHSPDNIKCVQGVSIGKSVDDSSDGLVTQGLSLANNNILISDLIYELANLKKIPSDLKLRYPNLTKDNYWAAMHAAYLILSAFDFSQIDESSKTITLSKTKKAELLKASLQSYNRLK